MPPNSKTFFRLAAVRAPMIIQLFEEERTRNNPPDIRIEIKEQQEAIRVVVHQPTTNSVVINMY